MGVCSMHECVCACVRVCVCVCACMCEWTACVSGLHVCNSELRRHFINQSKIQMKFEPSTSKSKCVAQQLEDMESHQNNNKSQETTNIHQTNVSNIIYK